MSSPKLINIREFRSDMTTFLKDAQERDIQFIIMRHASPVARVIPFDPGTTLEEVMGVKAAAGRIAQKKPKKQQQKPVKKGKRARRKEETGGLRKMFGF